MFGNTKRKFTYKNLIKQNNHTGLNLCGCCWAFEESALHTLFS